MVDGSSKGWMNRRTLTWAGYDVASSVYFGVAPAVLIPLYFQMLMAGQANPTAAWGALAAGAILASIVAALVAAALSSRMPRLRLLTGLTAGLVVSIAALGWQDKPSLAVAAAAFIAAQSFYFAATSVYESFLPDLLPQRLRQRLSGFGWAVGYLGGLVAVILLLGVVSGQPVTPRLIETCFGVLAALSGVLFIGVILLMRRSGFMALGEGSGGPPLWSLVTALGQWRANRPLYLLLAGTMLVHLGVSVVVTFAAPILATRFGQTLTELLWLLLLLHVLSVPSTIGWNLLMTKWSRLVPMTMLLAAWGLVLLLLAFGSGPWMPVATVGVIGCCVGATASALRGFLAEQVPPGSATAFFALSTVAGRVAAALGPATFALVTTLEGEQAALLVILLLLAAGALLVIRHLLQTESPGVAGEATPN